MKRTLQQINADIKNLEAKQKKELAKTNAKYKKAWNSVYRMMVAQEKKKSRKMERNPKKIRVEVEKNQQRLVL